MCRVVIWLFGLAWLASLFLLAVGTFGLFGQEKTPLAGVFLMPLGLPWTVMASSLNDQLLRIVAILAPGLNLAILTFLCGKFGFLGRRR